MGGGQLWPFSIGVGNHIYKHYDISRIKFLASSCGCFAAVPLACGLNPLDWYIQEWNRCLTHFSHRGILGCLFDHTQFYHELWDRYLPADAHLCVSGRLFLSVTLVPSMRNRVVSTFRTRDELLATLVASMCIPLLFIRNAPVCLHDTFAIDGGFSDNMPCLDSDTITVSALDVNAHIHPTTRIPLLDLIRVPSNARVQELAQMAELVASHSRKFQRTEWTSIART